MTMSKILAAGRRWAGRSLSASVGAVRSLSPSGLIVVACGDSRRGEWGLHVDRAGYAAISRRNSWRGKR
jgi:hypothetical protein